MPLRAAATLITLKLLCPQPMGRSLAAPVQPMLGKEHRFECQPAPGRRLKGANFVCVEARLLDGSRENSVHESFLRFPMQVVSPFFAFA